MLFKSTRRFVIQFKRHLQLPYTPTMSAFSTISPESRAFVDEFVTYLNDAATAFHAVSTSKAQLLAAGFVQIKEADQWNITAGGKYFFTRNATALIAFTVGAEYQPTNGFTIVGAHTDSPCFRVKAMPCSTKADSLVLNTQPYGGGLWHTWFDRDLGLAGRVITKNAAGEMSSKLVKIDHPVARIPNLAIHMQTPEERKAFAINLHEHCKAILTMDPDTVTETAPANGFHPCLMHVINENLNLDVEAGEVVLDMELQLTDTQPSAIGGAKDEFIFSGRLDNLCSSFQSVRALIDASAEASVDPTSDLHKNIQVVMLFDHEEVGSSSAQGAGSCMFMDTLKRIHKNFAPETSDALQQAFRRSLVISIDMAHAHHPNYPAKHDPAMAPKINRGLVIKHNANQRYATNTVSAIMFREFGQMAGLPMQEFSVRSDAGCGSTIGPIAATLSGITTIDVGSPQFSMHSIREMMGVKDVHTGYMHLKSTFSHHASVAEKMMFE
jgi:aspartyl aminopeptidase